MADQTLLFMVDVPVWKSCQLFLFLDNIATVRIGAFVFFMFSTQIQLYWIIICGSQIALNNNQTIKLMLNIQNMETHFQFSWIL
jgi:hypothetical protein